MDLFITRELGAYKRRVSLSPLIDLHILLHRVLTKAAVLQTFHAFSCYFESIWHRFGRNRSLVIRHKHVIAIPLKLERDTEWTSPTQYKLEGGTSNFFFKQMNNIFFFRKSWRG